MGVVRPVPYTYLLHIASLPPSTAKLFHPRPELVLDVTALLLERIDRLGIGGGEVAFRFRHIGN